MFIDQPLTFRPVPDQKFETTYPYQVFSRGLEQPFSFPNISPTVQPTQQYLNQNPSQPIPYSDPNHNQFYANKPVLTGYENGSKDFSKLIIRKLLQLLHFDASGTAGYLLSIWKSAKYTISSVLKTN
jgi:hypothetical protein